MALLEHVLCRQGIKIRMEESPAKLAAGQHVLLDSFSSSSTLVMTQSNAPDTVQNKLLKKAT